MTCRIIILALALGGIAGPGCSSEPFTSGQDGGPDRGLSSDLRPSGDEGAAVPDSGRCTSAAQCGPGEVCDPVTQACAQDLGCTGHQDCGPAAYCDGQVCRRSETGSPCAGDEGCMPGEICVGGYCGCEGQTYTAQNVGPNVLIVLDRSGSMDFEVDGGTKWDVARAAIADLLAAQGERIRFGLALYPGTNEDCTAGQTCSPGAVWVDPAPDTAAQITTTLAAVSTCVLGTPTAEMLSALLTYPGLADPARENVVLLITDGISTCGDPADAAADLRDLTPEVKTYVVGFGALVSEMELENIAKSGGTDDPTGPRDYYLAEDAATLTTALDTIAGQVLSCAYTLSDDPADLDQLYVYQDKQAVARDTAHTDGWDYDAASKQLTFYGPACEALRSGQVTDQVIVYGCPMWIE